MSEAQREHGAVGAHQKLGIDGVGGARRIHRQSEFRERHSRHARRHDQRVTGTLQFRERNDWHERRGARQILDGCVRVGVR